MFFWFLTSRTKPIFDIPNKAMLQKPPQNQFGPLRTRPIVIDSGPGAKLLSAPLSEADYRGERAKVLRDSAPQQLGRWHLGADVAPVDSLRKWAKEYKLLVFKFQECVFPILFGMILIYIHKPTKSNFYLAIFCKVGKTRRQTQKNVFVQRRWKHLSSCKDGQCGSAELVQTELGEWHPQGPSCNMVVLHSWKASRFGSSSPFLGYGSLMTEEEGN